MRLCNNIFWLVVGHKSLSHWYKGTYKLGFRFTLCMRDFFDSIPQDQWKINDPAFIKQSEEFAITKFKDWIIEQIT